MREISQEMGNVLRTVSTEPELGDIYQRAIRDYESLETVEAGRFTALIIQMFRVYEHTFYRFQEHRMDPQLWEGFEAQFLDLLAYPGLQAWWGTRRHWFGSDFRAHVDAHTRSGREPTLWERGEDQT